MRIANSFADRNSYSCMVDAVADSYHHRMRGEELKEIRRQNLLRLRQQHTLEEIAERTGTNSAYLSQIANRVIQKNGRSPRALSDAYAGKIERGLGLPENWMDQDRGPVVVEGVLNVDLLPPVTASARLETFMPITTWDDPSDLPEGQYVIIPRRRINLSAGNGNLVFEEEEAPGLAFTTQWVRQTGIKPSNAIVVYAKGDSMEPKIHDGDILLVDLAATKVRDGEVYAVRYNQEVRVKRLFCRYDGALILRSDNAAKYPDEIVPPEHQDGHVHILGRVIWRGGDV